MNLSRINGSTSTESALQSFKAMAPSQMALHANVTEFDQVINALVPSGTTTDSPSTVGQWMRAPMTAYRRVMESIDKPAPAEMPVMQAMEFYARKQIDLNEAKTLQNVVATFAKLAKKNVETVLNNK